MHFVTTKHPAYVLFCTTPSERAALGLNEENEVHLLVWCGSERTWTVLRSWPAARFSHTDFLALLRDVPEPENPEDLLRYLPPDLR